MPNVNNQVLPYTPPRISRPTNPLLSLDKAHTCSLNEQKVPIHTSVVALSRGWQKVPVEEDNYPMRHR